MARELSISRSHGQAIAREMEEEKAMATKWYEFRSDYFRRFLQQQWTLELGNAWYEEGPCHALGLAWAKVWYMDQVKRDLTRERNKAMAFYWGKDLSNALIQAMDKALLVRKIYWNLTNKEEKRFYNEIFQECHNAKVYLYKQKDTLNKLYAARRTKYLESLLPWNWGTPTIPSAPNVKDAAKNIAVKIAIKLGNKIPKAVKVVFASTSLLALLIAAMKLIAQGGTPGAIGLTVLTKASELFHAFWAKTPTQQQVAVEEKNVFLPQKIVNKIFGKEASRVSSATENQKTDYSYLYLLLGFIFILLLLAVFFGRKQLNP